MKQPQVGQGLFEVYRSKFLNRLQFDEHDVVHEQVDPEDLTENLTIDRKWHHFLALNDKSSVPEPFGQNDFIHRLQHTRPDLAMQSDALIQNDAGDPVDP